MYSVCPPTLPQPTAKSKASAATCKVQREPQALQIHRMMFCALACVRLLQGLFCSAMHNRNLKGADLQDGVCWLACDLPHSV